MVFKCGMAFCEFVDEFQKGKEESIVVFRATNLHKIELLKRGPHFAYCFHKFSYCYKFSWRTSI